jgi:hypothetical protein
MRCGNQFPSSHQRHISDALLMKLLNKARHGLPHHALHFDHCSPPITSICRCAGGKRKDDYDTSQSSVAPLAMRSFKFSILFPGCCIEPFHPPFFAGRGNNSTGCSVRPRNFVLPGITRLPSGYPWPLCAAIKVATSSSNPSCYQRIYCLFSHTTTSHARILLRQPPR